uniref:Uncharacterized protein n=1 Tax=Moniliophthora roreri TaxID=221103 RepID=A0A0W0F9K6_MONRR
MKLTLLTQLTTSNVDQVGVAIGLRSCQPGKCFKATAVLGTAQASMLPPQNFSVYIPSDFPRGNAVLGLVNLGPVRAGHLGVYDTHNITVSVVHSCY